MIPKGSDEKFVAKIVYFTRQRRNPMDFTVRHFAGTLLFLLCVCREKCCLYVCLRKKSLFEVGASVLRFFCRYPRILLLVCALIYMYHCYSGDVKYHAKDFLEKNKDVLAEALLDQMNLSSIPMLVAAPEPEAAAAQSGGMLCVCSVCSVCMHALFVVCRCVCYVLPALR